MVRNRTFNTLFMICSLDGKISTGETDERDVDKDFPKIKGVKEGLKQYYQLECRTDINSFNTIILRACSVVGRLGSELATISV